MPVPARSHQAHRPQPHHRGAAREDADRCRRSEPPNSPAHRDRRDRPRVADHRLDHVGARDHAVIELPLEHQHGRHPEAGQRQRGDHEGRHQPIAPEGRCRGREAHGERGGGRELKPLHRAELLAARRLRAADKRHGDARVRDVAGHGDQRRPQRDEPEVARHQQPRQHQVADHSQAEDHEAPRAQSHGPAGGSALYLFGGERIPRRC